MTAYVLIHGGGSTARFWDRVVPLLADHDQAADLVAVDLPGRGGHPADLASITVDDEVDSVLADTVDVAPDGPLVLVAHSSGGLVVPGVVEALAGRVTEVLLIAALVPPEGGTGLDCMQPRHAEGLRTFAESLGPDDPPITLPGPPEDPEPFRTATGGDPLDDDDLAFVVDPVRLVPDTVHHYFQPLHWSAVLAQPPSITYLFTLRDRPIPIELQREMAERLPLPYRTVDLDTGHLAPITHPEAVVSEIIRASAPPR